MLCFLGGRVRGGTFLLREGRNEVPFPRTRDNLFLGGALCTAKVLLGGKGSERGNITEKGQCWSRGLHLPPLKGGPRRGPKTPKGCVERSPQRGGAKPGGGTKQRGKEWPATGKNPNRIPVCFQETCVKKPDVLNTAT